MSARNPVEGEHLKRQDQSGYSLIMSAFEGRFRFFQEAADTEFGRTGISAFSLCLESDILPAEIASGLDMETAKRIAASLETVGASMTVVPSREVEGVLTYAEECWPHRSAGNWRFAEVEDMVLILSALNARGNIKVIRKRRPEAKRWQMEAALNHRHPSNEYSRHALRMAGEMGAELTTALREAYPERSFIVDYWENQVSFYQRGDGAPEEAESPPAMQDKTWCDRCGGNRAYRLRSETDPEFPKADWGDCMECGGEVLVRTWRFRTLVGR